MPPDSLSAFPLASLNNLIFRKKKFSGWDATFIYLPKPIAAHHGTSFSFSLLWASVPFPPCAFQTASSNCEYSPSSSPLFFSSLTLALHLQNDASNYDHADDYLPLS